MAQDKNISRCKIKTNMKQKRTKELTSHNLGFFNIISQNVQ